MYIIDVKISDDRNVECENICAGAIGESNVTRLKFTVPEEYSNFSKYLDIIKGDGEKTQTVIEDDKNNAFYYTLPYSLTKDDEITLQLVLKREDKIFKSNIFSLHFNGSIDATGKLTGDYQDTIEFIMENKVSREELEEVNNKLALKTSKDEFYNYCRATDEALKEKASEEDLCLAKKDMVKKTDIASPDSAGIVKVKNGNAGLNMYNGFLCITPATTGEIEKKAHLYRPVTPAKLELAVKVCTNQSVDNPEMDASLPVSTGAVESKFADLPIEKGAGDLSLQTKEWVGDEEEEPRKSEAEGLGSVSLGLGNYTAGKASVALGKCTAAPVSYSTATGIRTSAFGQRSTAMGYSGISAYFDAGLTPESTKEEITASWLENSKNFTLAKGNGSMALVENCLALGRSSFASGMSSVAYNNFAIAMGNQVVAFNEVARAYGHGTNVVFSVLPDLNTDTGTEDIYNAWLTKKFNLAFKSHSVADGRDCVALGLYSQSRGYENFVEGSCSVAFMYNNYVNGDYSATLGRDNEITAPWAYSIGTGNSISGTYGFAVGRDNQIDKPGGMAFGRGLTISNSKSCCLGQYNEDVADSDLQFIIGKGDSDTARANLMEYRRNVDTLDIYAEDVAFTKADGTKISVYELYEQLKQANETIAKLTKAIENLGGAVEA